MATAAINVYEKTPQGYVVFHIEVGCRGSSWDIKRRFNDFVALHHDLCRELKNVDLGELPRKRFFGRFDPVFLEERQRDLRVYLNNVLNKVPDVGVGAIGDFLESFLVERSISRSPAFYRTPSNDAPSSSSSSDGGGGGDSLDVSCKQINDHLSERMDIEDHPYVGFIAEQEELEQKRLAALVENFASAMIDSSSVGVEPRGDAEVEAQREKLLKACNGFSAFDEHLKRFFNGPVPSETEWDTAEEMVEEMCNIPNVSVKNQLKATNAGTIDGFVTPVILENGQSLVCHMHTPSVI